MTLHPHAARRARLIRLIRREKLDALLVTNVHNVRYLSGFLGDDSALLVTPGRTTLLTDSRYAEQAEAETRGIGIVVRKEGHDARRRRGRAEGRSADARRRRAHDDDGRGGGSPQGAAARRDQADARDGGAAPDHQGRVGNRRDLARGRRSPTRRSA